MQTFPSSCTPAPRSKPLTNTDARRLRLRHSESWRALAKPVRVCPWLILKPRTNTDARRLRLHHSQLGRALAKPVRVCLWFITISASVQSSSFCPFLQRVLQRTIHKNILVFSTHTIPASYLQPHTDDRHRARLGQPPWAGFGGAQPIRSPPWAGFGGARAPGGAGQHPRAAEPPKALTHIGTRSEQF